MIGSPEVLSALRIPKVSTIPRHFHSVFALMTLVVSFSIDYKQCKLVTSHNAACEDEHNLEHRATFARISQIRYAIRKLIGVQIHVSI